MTTTTIRYDAEQFLQETPEELVGYPYWAPARLVWQDGKLKKVPFSPETGSYLKANDTAGWTDFFITAEHCLQHRTPAGLLLWQEDEAEQVLVGLDLDDCITDGQLSDLAQKALDTLPTYAERSLRGTGIHFLMWMTRKDVAELQRRYMNKNSSLDTEVYFHARYFIVTGNRMNEHHIQLVRLQDIAWLLQEKPMPSAPRGNPMTAAVSDDDQELLQKAMNARNGEKFRELWYGDTSRYGGDASDADLALMSMLLYWCGGDVDRAVRLFEQSALGQREKWQSRPDYRQRTIQAALETSAAFGRGVNTRGVDENEVDDDAGDATTTVFTSCPDRIVDAGYWYCTGTRPATTIPNGHRTQTVENDAPACQEEPRNTDNMRLICDDYDQVFSGAMIPNGHRSDTNRTWERYQTDIEVIPNGHAHETERTSGLCLSDVSIREAVHEAMRDGVEWRITDVASRFGLSSEAARRHLRILMAEGKVVRVGHGVYQVAGATGADCVTISAFAKMHGISESAAKLRLSRMARTGKAVALGGGRYVLFPAGERVRARVLNVRRGDFGYGDRVLVELDIGRRYPARLIFTPGSAAGTAILRVCGIADVSEAVGRELDCTVVAGERGGKAVYNVVCLFADGAPVWYKGSSPTHDAPAKAERKPENGRRLAEPDEPLLQAVFASIIGETKVEDIFRGVSEHESRFTNFHVVVGRALEVLQERGLIEYGLFGGLYHCYRRVGG